MRSDPTQTRLRAQALLQEDRPCRLLRFAPWRLPNPSLHGHADVEFAGGWRIHQIPIFRTRDGSLRVGVPSIPMLDAEGRVRLDRDGKRQYVSAISFASNDARDRWFRMIGGALDAAGIRGLVGEDVP
jgi:hypothetical protein